MALSSRRGHEPAPAWFVEDGIRCAYTLIETARIRCERLLDSLDPHTVAATVAIHRDLGLAGYYCSSEMPGPLRQSCLLMAHELCDSEAADGLHVKLRKAFDEALSACDAIARVLSEGPIEYAHIAHVHVMSALESLDSCLAHVSSPG